MLARNIRTVQARVIRPMSIWAKVPLAPPDAIFGLTAAFKNDPAEMKINLGVGAYRDDAGKPFPLPSVREAEKRILERNVDHEYAPIQGNELFLKLSEEFVFGAGCPAIEENRVASIQCLSGTGALRLFAECVVSAKGAGTSIHLPNPTWANHANIFRRAGLAHSLYDYYDASTCSFDAKRMMANLESCPDNEIFLLHACAHNPTGCDPSMDEWRDISDIMKRKNHVCLFDNAYQGYSSGDAEQDAKVIRFFVSEGHNAIICQSYSKNFGLYGQRVGSLSIVTQSEDERDRVNSLLRSLARAMYSNPPIYGARIVAEILTSPDLKAMWVRDCRKMTQRIIGMRAALRKHLEDAGSKVSWKHITDQTGMFCYSGLTAEQVTRLRDEFHIYCTTDGRISIAGVTSGNVAYLAQAMHAVTSRE